MRNFIFAVLTAATILFGAEAVANPLSPFERSLFALWAGNPDKRPEIAQAYKDDVKAQIEALQSQLPGQISQYTILEAIEFVDNETIVYTYRVAARDKSQLSRSYQEVNAELSATMCASEQTAFMFMMGVKIKQFYYLRDGKTLFAEHNFDSSTCEGNSI